MENKTAKPVKLSTMITFMGTPWIKMTEKFFPTEMMF